MTGLTQLVPAPFRPLARKVRSAARRFQRSPLDRLLTPAEARAALDPVSGTYLVERSQTFACPVRVTNRGPAVLSSHGRNGVQLTGRWLGPKGKPLGLPAPVLALPHPVAPGETVLVDARLTAPEFLGHFKVEWDLAQAGGPAFADLGNRPAAVEVQVTGRSADEIDYYKAYASADLTRDFWTVVGPPSKGEFDRLGQAKLNILKDLGAKPNSRILDVGCGTGQLAVPLEGFLTADGFYLGTDVGPEAIAYCHQHYKRPNFRFAVNEMTRLPVEGAKFDFIVYFSVFTHTYPDETALLLADSARVLAPGGVILADLFTSPMVERYSGNRGAVEVNREHTLRLVELTGMKAEVYQTSPWQKYGKREFFKFTKR
jgi:SAM-dependent methyltransferase